MTERMLDLLRAQHDFPGPFMFKVIYKAGPGVGDRVVAAVCEATGIAPPATAPTTRQSGGGKFESMTLDLEVRSAEEVLTVYEILNGFEQVLSAF